MDKKESWFSAKKQRNILVIIILLLGGIGVYGLNRINSLNTQLAVSEQNQKALADSVRVTTNKLGESEYSKNILISEKKHLDKLNSDLAEELSHEKGKVWELTKYIVSISNTSPDGTVDTIYITNTLIKYPDGSNGLEWEHDTIYDLNNERHLAGISKFKVDTLTGVVTPLETLITKDEIKFDIVQGLRELDGNLEMFVRSTYPGFGVEDLNSVILDPKKHPILKKFTKKKKFGLGPYIGFGFDQGLTPSVQLGIGVTYDLIQF
jgi:hypothetical protein